MSAQLQTVPLATSRPEYENTYLGYETDWIEANMLALLSWWDAGENEPKDFPQFARSQHDLELDRREDFRNTLRQY